MSITKKDFLSNFALSQKTVHLNSINADVVIRNFTAEENDKFTEFMVTGLNKQGEPEIDLGKSMQLKYMKISAALIEPKIKEKELKEMYGAKDFIEEMMEIIDGKSEEKYDEEGNVDSPSGS